MSVYDILDEVREKVSGISVKTVKIGIEPSLRPVDYPIIRVVAGDNKRSSNDGWGEDIEVLVYFGDKIADKAGIEAIYSYLYGLEAEIKALLNNQQVSNDGIMQFISTHSDEDRLENFKILCSRYVIKGVRF